jgi:predicted small lipoprotein YifL
MRTVLLAMLALTLVACGASGPSNAPSSDASPEASADASDATPVDAEADSGPSVEEWAMCPNVASVGYSVRTCDDARLPTDGGTSRFPTWLCDVNTPERPGAVSIEACVAAKIDAAINVLRTRGAGEWLRGCRIEDLPLPCGCNCAQDPIRTVSMCAGVERRYLAAQINDVVQRAALTGHCWRPR